jgi:glycosyltransferase involved in cell wall biosynthesis
MTTVRTKRGRRVAAGLLFGAEACLAAPVLYLGAVALSARLRAKRAAKDEVPRAPGSTAVVARKTCRFAVLIPAHNEEVLLGATLASLTAQAYPVGARDLYVVADNCTDATAAVARAAGASVFERADATQRGKGYALRWLLDRIRETAGADAYDAFVVIDADTEVAPGCLAAMARALEDGARAVQGQHTVLNGRDSPATVLRWVALTLMNHVRPLGRDGLGGSSTLTGNGMCFRGDLLAEHPWSAYGLSEDYEFYLYLVERGERVRYVPEALVRARMSSSLDQMRSQDVRWESLGTRRTAVRVAWDLLRAAVRRRSLVPVEAVGELLTPPLSPLTAWCTLTLPVGLLLRSPRAVAGSLLLSAGLAWYVGTAASFLPLTRGEWLRFLMTAPRFALWKLWVFYVLRRSPRYAEWLPASRPVALPAPIAAQGR